MPNIYDTVAQSNLVDVFTPVPFESIVQAGIARQQRLNQQLDRLEGLREQSYLLQSMPGADTEFIRKQQAVIEDIADKYAHEDLSDPFMVSELGREFRQQIDRPSIQAVQQSAQAYQNYMKLRSKMLVEGRTPVLEPNIAEYSTLDSGVFTGTPEAALDHYKTAQDYFQSMRDTFGGIQEDPKTGILGLYSGVTSGVISKRAQEVTDDFLRSAEGRQYVRIQQSRGDERSAKEIAGSYLEDVGQEFARTEFRPLSAGYQRKQQPSKLPTTDFLLRTQPTDAPKSYRTLSRDIDKLEKEQNSLFSQADQARVQGQPQLALQLEQRAADLGRESGLESFKYWKTTIEEQVKNRNKDFLVRKGKEFTGLLDKFDISIPEGTTKEEWEEVFANLISEETFSRGAPFITLEKNLTDKYEEIYGVSINPIEFKTKDPSKHLGRAVQKASEDKKRLKDIMSAEWEAVRAAGIIENTVLLPLIETESDKKRYPELREMYETIKTTTSDFKIEVVSSDKKIKKAKEIDKIKDAEQINFISARADDPKGSYIYFTIPGSEVGYKAYLQTPAQNRGIANTYFRRGDFGTGYSFLFPTLGQEIEENFKLNARPELFTLNFGTMAATLVKQENDTYDMIGPKGELIETGLSNKSDIKNTAYEVLNLLSTKQ